MYLKIINFEKKLFLKFDRFKLNTNEKMKFLNDFNDSSILILGAAGSIEVF